MRCIDCKSYLTTSDPLNTIESCIACGAKWKTVLMTSFNCVSCAYIGPEPNESLDLEHDNRTGWFECPKCCSLNNEDDVHRWKESRRSG